MSIIFWVEMNARRLMFLALCSIKVVCMCVWSYVRFHFSLVLSTSPKLHTDRSWLSSLFSGIPSWTRCKAIRPWWREQDSGFLFHYRNWTTPKSQRYHNWFLASNHSWRQGVGKQLSSVVFEKCPTYYFHLLHVIIHVSRDLMYKLYRSIIEGGYSAFIEYRIYRKGISNFSTSIMPVWFLCQQLLNTTRA